MNEQNRTQLLIDYLKALSHLKHADFFANKEIGRVIEQIERELNLK
ncbi:hypothetical protein [Rossellomorea aquimaris]|nr:hypothetical protein [Rossellomorea aquimaris]